MTSDAVRINISGSVMTLTLDVPEIRNALTAEIEAGLVRGIEAAASSDVRAVVLTGNGAAFCAGASTKELGANDEKDLASLRARARVIPDTILQPLVRLEKPVIAAVNGWAVGAGIGIALACDFRLGSDSTRFLFGFRRLALVPDLGIAWFLPRLIGYRAARDLLFADRQLDAAAALEVGLLDELVPQEDLLPRADALARELASGPTLALGLMKRMLHTSSETNLGSFLEEETLVQTMLVRASDHQEGVDALAARRPPDFRGC